MRSGGCWRWRDLTDNVSLWIVDSHTGETILKVEERRRCPVHITPLRDNGTCDECGGLDWTIFS